MGLLYSDIFLDRGLMRHPLQVLAALALALSSLGAHAARPMTTDDARIVDTQACQVESWLRVNRGGAEQFWAVPACTPVDNLELSLGGAQERLEGQARLSNTLAQGKWVLRPLAANDWGLAMTLGRATERGPAPDKAKADSDYVNLPLSFSRRDDAVLLHLNLGLRRDREQRQTLTTWGLSTELVVRPGLQLIAETFGESSGRPFAHGGLRWWLVPDRVQLDATYGQEMRSSNAQRWITLGLRIMTPAFLP